MPLIKVGDIDHNGVRPTKRVLDVSGARVSFPKVIPLHASFELSYAIEPRTLGLAESGSRGAFT
jgi:hypothetical protein